MSEALRAIHHSVMAKRDKYADRIRPQNMSIISVTSEQRCMLEQVALDIFTDMTNAGATFHQAMASVYLSGLKHATEAQSMVDENISPKEIKS